MAIVPNVRVAVQPLFPALVQGSGPVTVTKMNGIWTIGLNAGMLGQQVPPPANYATDFVLVWDSIAQQFVLVSLQSLQSIAARTQRSVTASPIVIASTDGILNVNISAVSPTCTLPAAATRNGVALTFKDVGAQFTAHPLTITAASGETIDGSATLVLNTNRTGATLMPFNDGVNVGWAIYHI